jgi:hypothetical protein
MKQGITINLDKPRTLRYGINALAKIEDVTGKPLMQLDLNNVGIKDLLAIVYSGLYHEDKDLTIDTVGDLIDEYSNLSVVAEAVGKALTLAFGEAKEKNIKGN